MLRMRDEWIAVARGLKCLSISITAIAIAAILTVAAIPLLVLLSIVWPTGGSGPQWLLIVPAIISAFIALVYSRISRIVLLKVPRNIPSARLSATASFLLELIGQTGLGVHIALRAFHFGFADRLPPLLVGVFLIAGFVGWLYFQRVLFKITDHIACADAGNNLTRAWGLFGFACILIVLGCTTAYLSNGSVIICLSGLIILAALFMNTIALNHYSQAISSLRYSALREAVRCENRH